MDEKHEGDAENSSHHCGCKVVNDGTRSHFPARLSDAKVTRARTWGGRSVIMLFCQILPFCLIACKCLKQTAAHTFASSCARPAISDETMSGSISIFNILIKISPGKEISMIVSSDHLPYRSRNPIRIPSTTPATVRTSSAFVFNHDNSFDAVGQRKQK